MSKISKITLLQIHAANELLSEYRRIKVVLDRNLLEQRCAKKYKREVPVVLHVEVSLSEGSHFSNDKVHVCGDFPDQYKQDMSKHMIKLFKKRAVEIENSLRELGVDV